MANYSPLAIYSGGITRPIQTADGIKTNILDTHTGTTMAIGGTTATKINIGRVGMVGADAVEILTNLKVAGALNVVQGATFEDANVTFKGDVIFGDSVTDDTVQFVSPIISNGLGGLDEANIQLQSGAAGTIQGRRAASATQMNIIGYSVDATTDNNGGDLVVRAGDGGSLNTGASQGGDLQLISGGGNSQSGAASGDVIIRSATPAGSAVIGLVNINTVDAGGTVNVDKSGAGSTSVLAVQGDLTVDNGGVSLTADAASDFTTAAGALTLSDFTTVELQQAGTTHLQINAAGMEFDPGAGGLEFTMNAASLFALEGYVNENPGVNPIDTANLTSTNLNRLVNNSGTVDDLHTHSAAATSVEYPYVTTGLTQYNLAAADAANSGQALHAKADVLATASVIGQIKTVGASGVISIGPKLSSVPYAAGNVPTAGDILYLSAVTAGAVVTPPDCNTTSGSGECLAEVGIALEDGAGGVVKILWQPKRVVEF